MDINIYVDEDGSCRKSADAITVIGYRYDIVKSKILNCNKTILAPNYKLYIEKIINI